MSACHGPRRPAGEAGACGAFRRAALRWMRGGLLAGLLAGLLTGAGGAAAQAAPTGLPGLPGLSGLSGPPGAAVPPTQQATCPPPLPTPADSQLVARDRGLLWRATRDGRTIHLFGTLHVGKPQWRLLGPQTRAALHASDVLALEIDPNDPALLKALEDTRPPQPLTEPLRQRLDRAFERACLAAEALGAMHPVLQAATLTMLEARWLGLDARFAMEQLLAAQARQQGLRIVALESAATQIRALVPDDETQARLLLAQSLQQLEDRSARRVLGTLGAAWEAGDLAMLEDHERWCECADSEADRLFLRQLNDDRNAPLADGIERLHVQGAKVFVAVGALHFTGPQSLPRLLAQRGFKVERMPFRR